MTDGGPEETAGAVSDPVRAVNDPALRPLDVRVRILWRIGTGIRAVAWTGIAAAVEAFGRDWALVDALLPAGLATGVLTATVAGLGAALLLVVPGLRYRRWRYALRASDLWIRTGILFHRVSVIPYRRLQFVDTRQGPVERWMGLTELVVHTAAPGTSGRIPGLASAEAERIRDELARFEPGDGDPEPLRGDAPD